MRYLLLIVMVTVAGCATAPKKKSPNDRPHIVTKDLSSYYDKYKCGLRSVTNEKNKVVEKIFSSKLLCEKSEEFKSLQMKSEDDKKYVVSVSGDYELGCSTKRYAKNIVGKNLFKKFNDCKKSEDYSTKRIKLINKYVRDNKKYSKFKKEALAKSITMGMPESLVYLSWGTPIKINKTVGTWGTHKQCIYSGHYVYIKNGILSSWQNK